MLSIKADDYYSRQTMNDLQDTKNITMKEVAQRLNLSVSTISRAFTRSHLVELKTRQKIEDICKKLNYRPNLNARAIATKKTNMVGFIARIQNFETFVYNVERMLYQNGYALQIELGHSGPKHESQIVESMLDRHTDGIILCSRHYTDKIEAIEILRNTNTPFVVLGYYHDQTVSQVVEDLHAGSKTVIKHLISHGHSRIAMVTYQEGDPRISGYIQAHMEEGISIDENLIFRISPKMDELEEVINTLIEIKTTAIFAMHDLMASIADISKTDIWDPPLTVYEVAQDNFASSIGYIMLEKIKHPNGLHALSISAGSSLSENPRADSDLTTAELFYLYF